MTELDAYLAPLPPERRAKVEQVIAAVRAVAPDAVEGFEYKMPYFTRGERHLGVADRARYVAVYCTTAAADLKAASPKAKAGGGCVQYPDGVPIPQDALEAAVLAALS